MQFLLNCFLPSWSNSGPMPCPSLSHFLPCYFELFPKIIRFCHSALHHWLGVRDGYCWSFSLRVFSILPCPRDCAWRGWMFMERCPYQIRHNYRIQVLFKYTWNIDHRWLFRPQSKSELTYIYKYKCKYICTYEHWTHESNKK